MSGDYNKKTYMVSFDLPNVFTEEFMALIPQQRYVINQMLVEGAVQSYSLAMDRSSLWVVMLADNELELMQQIERMPLSDFMESQVQELMFYNTSTAVMHFSLN